jgi:hypothetical protein
MGAEVNNVSQYEFKAGGSSNPTAPAIERFAPWNAAQVVVLFPSPLETESRNVDHTAPERDSLMLHFAEYVKGAAGLDGSNDTAIVRV